MSTITSYDDALDFMPKAEAGPQRTTVFARVRIVIQAIGDGLTAARRYEQLTARGMAPDRAARTVFNETFDH